MTKRRAQLRKRCACPTIERETCVHPWHFSFFWTQRKTLYGSANHRYSLTKVALANHLVPPRTRDEAERMAVQLRDDIIAGRFRTAPDPGPPLAYLKTPKRAYVANQSAQAVADRLRKMGCHVWLSGWPDLLVQYGETIFAAEVKFGRDRLSRDQRRVQRLLCESGLATFEVRDEISHQIADRIGATDDSGIRTKADAVCFMTVDKLCALIQSLKDDPLPTSEAVRGRRDRYRAMTKQDIHGQPIEGS